MLCIFNRQIPLFDAYNAVVSRGGFEHVCAEHLWHHVALALDIWPFQACTTPSLLFELRQQYALILADYEHQMLRRGLWSLPRPSATGDLVRVPMFRRPVVT